MNKEEFLELVKQYSNNAKFLSGFKINDPAYLKLLDAGSDALPFALELLHNNTNINSNHDIDNNQWMLIMLVDQISNGKCLENLPEEVYGNLIEIRTHI